LHASKLRLDLGASMEDARAAFQVASTALAELATTIPEVRRLVRQFSVHMQEFLTAGKEAQVGSLNDLNGALVHTFLLISGLNRAKDLKIQVVRRSLFACQQRAQALDDGRRVFAEIQTSCDAIRQGLVQIEDILSDVERRLDMELEGMFEAALTNDTLPEMVAFAKKIIDRASL